MGGRSRCLVLRNGVDHERSPAPPATIVPPATGRGHSLPVAFLPLIERSVPDDMLRNTVAEAAALLLGRRVCFMRLQ